MKARKLEPYSSLQGYICSHILLCAFVLHFLSSMLSALVRFFHAGVGIHGYGGIFLFGLAIRIGVYTTHTYAVGNISGLKTFSRMFPFA